MAKEIEISKENIFERPAFLNSMPTRGKRYKQASFDAERIKKLSATACISYTVAEFVEKYAVRGKLKQACSGIKTYFRKKRGLKDPRIEESDGRIWMWDVWTAGRGGKK